MKSRLRARRSHEDELIAPESAQRPAAGPARPLTGLMALQKTIGNAALQRQLQGQSKTAEPSGAQRAPDQPGTKTDAAPPKPQSIMLLKITTADGKEIRGPSKRKGHEGKFELLGFRNEKSQNMARPMGRPNSGEPSTSTEYSEDATVTKSKELAEFTFIKTVDSASPLLMQYAVSGQKLVMQVELITVGQDGRESPTLKIDLPDVVITSAQPGGNDADKANTPLESISVQSVGVTTTAFKALERR